MGKVMITSMTNQRVKRIVQLNKGAGLRKKEDVFVAEGIKMFLEAPEEKLEEVYISENFSGHCELPGEDGKKIKRSWSPAVTKRCRRKFLQRYRIPRRLREFCSW